MIADMPRKPKVPKPAETPKDADRHLPRSMVSLPPDLHKQLKKLAKMNNRPLSWQIRLILVAELEKEGLWPPPEGESAGQ